MNFMFYMFVSFHFWGKCQRNQVSKYVINWYKRIEFNNTTAADENQFIEKKRKCIKTSAIEHSNTLRRLLLRLQRSPCRPPRSLSRVPRDPREPPRIHLLPYLLRRTSGRKLVWRTSSQTCGRDEPKPRRWPWCWTTCRRHVAPWRDHHQAPRSGVGS